MWQVLLAAAAAAGSGILAKKLISPSDTEKPTSDCDLVCSQNKSPPPQDSIFQENWEAFSNEANIFRFSCPEAESTEFKKAKRSGIKKIGGSKRGKKIGTFENGRKELVGNQIANGSGKKISICLKKRRTGRHGAGKCESRASKDNTFGWGVGVGIMYMMSAGNAEITKLNSAMDETVKTIQELKAEISTRKSSLNVNVPAAESEDETKTSYSGPLFGHLSPSSKDNNVKTFGPASTEEGKCASTIVTVAQQPEVLEMHRLEAELESELQKLPWVATEGSGSEGRIDIFEAEDLSKDEPWENFENPNSYQQNGVLPTELDQKLCHLLIEQQESQIVELEAELNQAHSKLHQKEAELQALKDRVKRLTEFSLVNASDEETEVQEDVRTLADEIKEKMVLEDTRSSRVGTKRTFGYGEAYISSRS